MFDLSNECHANQHQPYSHSWNYSEDSNYHSMRKYIDSLFSSKSRLLVVRVDIGFQANAIGQYDPCFARDCFQRFMNNRRRNKIFDEEVGYLWSLEFGIDKGFHYHCMFFFDGHLRQQGSFIGNSIGEYWMNSITGGIGCYFCSNHSIDSLARQGFPIGIGMIKRGDEILRENLVSCATYLLKEGDELLLHRLLPEGLKGFRTFGRGVMA